MRQAMKPEDIQRVFTSLNQTFLPERAKGLNVTIQVEVIGEGDYNLTIRDEKLSFAPGKVNGAHLTLRATSSDLDAIFQRKLNPTAAFFQGKLTVQGDMGLAMKLPGLFK
jgi:putative sterol carrier protein